MPRPYIIINCAMSADGKIALPTRKQTRISSEKDMKRVHLLRAGCDAILVGIGTILADDPSLTVKKKYVPNAKNPLRIVLDSKGMTPESAKVLNDEAPTLIAVSQRCRKKSIGKADIAICGRERIELPLLMKELEKRSIKRLMVEGGGGTIWSFIKKGYFDELIVFVGSIVIGGGPTMADGSAIKSLEETVKLKIDSVERFGSGILVKYLPD